MKVVLLESISNLGGVGDVVQVRDGYARNFLLPRKKVMAATERNVRLMEHQRRIADHKVQKARAAAEDIKKKLQSQALTISHKAGKSEKLFGSVTAADIERALSEKGFVIPRRYIHLNEPIRKTGTFTVPVKLEGGLDTEIQVEVVARVES